MLLWPAGNKLFQGKFITAIYGSLPVFKVLQWTLLNSFIAVCGEHAFALSSPHSLLDHCLCNSGYYFAAFTIDRPWMGRWRMQGGSSACCRIICMMMNGCLTAQ